jgi:hypothetical protein
MEEEHIRIRAEHLKREEAILSAEEKRLGIERPTP